MAPLGALDPWLCVPTFRWVCLYRREKVAIFVRSFTVYHIAHSRVNSEKVLGVETKCKVRTTKGGQFLGRCTPESDPESGMASFLPLNAKYSPAVGSI